MQLPKARTADILEQEAGSELLIYDLRTDKMFQLNETSKIVYKACGKLSFDELKHHHKFSDDLICFALDELKANNLIEDYKNNHFVDLSRRDVIRKVGLASMVALPIVSGLVAPSAAQAASPPVCTGTRSSGSAVNDYGDGDGDRAAQATCLQRLNCQCVSGNANGSIRLCAGATIARRCNCTGTCT